MMKVKITWKYSKPPIYRAPIYRVPRFTGLNSFPQIQALCVKLCKLNFDLPGPLIYRAFLFPPRGPVNRGSTVSPSPSLYRKISASSNLDLYPHNITILAIIGQPINIDNNWLKKRKFLARNSLGIIFRHGKIGLKNVSGVIVVIEGQLANVNRRCAVIVVIEGQLANVDRRCIVIVTDWGTTSLCWWRCIVIMTDWGTAS